MAQSTVHPVSLELDYLQVLFVPQLVLFPLHCDMISVVVLQTQLCWLIQVLLVQGVSSVVDHCTY